MTEDTRRSLRKLRSYERTIEQLLNMPRPSVILKEKLTQVEELVANIGGQLGDNCNEWHDKIAIWWERYVQLAEMSSCSMPGSPVSSRSHSYSSLNLNNSPVLKSRKVAFYTASSNLAHTYNLSAEFNQKQTDMTKYEAGKTAIHSQITCQFAKMPLIKFPSDFECIRMLADLVVKARVMLKPYWKEHTMLASIFHLAFIKLPPELRDDYSRLYSTPAKGLAKSLHYLDIFLTKQLYDFVFDHGTASTVVQSKVDLYLMIEGEFNKLGDLHRLDHLKALLILMSKVLKAFGSYNKLQSDLFSVIFNKLSPTQQSAFRNHQTEDFCALRSFIANKIVWLHKQRNLFPTATDVELSPDAILATIRREFLCLPIVQHLTDFGTIQCLLNTIAKGRILVSTFGNVDRQLEHDLCDLALAKMLPEVREHMDMDMDVKQKSLSNLYAQLVKQIDELAAKRKVVRVESNLCSYCKLADHTTVSCPHLSTICLDCAEICGHSTDVCPVAGSFDCNGSFNSLCKV